jgi:hypothetical protein
MTLDEAIIIDKLPTLVYHNIATEAVRYALISVCFTYDRMDKQALMPRINNIFKGKLSEGIFYHYCAEHNIPINHQDCATPFWLPDLRDFVWLNGEWDLKNNFFYCNDDDFQKFDFTALPALIPNKSWNDQWSKRDDLHMNDTRFCAYLFSFMRLKPNGKPFFRIELSGEQVDFLCYVNTHFEQSPYGLMPFEAQWFYEQMAQKGSTEFIHLNYYPEMILTACANARYWSLFKNTSATEEHGHYISHFPAKNWYKVDGSILKFVDDALITKIKNMTCPIALLPSLKSLIGRYLR